jgi:hypothetical protein
MPSVDERVQRYAEAIQRDERETRRFGTIVRDVMAVADAEQAELRVEVERLNQLLGKLACDCDDYGGWHMNHSLYNWKRRAEAAEAKVLGGDQ